MNHVERKCSEKGVVQRDENLEDIRKLIDWFLLKSSPGPEG